MSAEQDVEATRRETENGSEASGNEFHTTFEAMQRAFKEALADEIRRR